MSIFYIQTNGGDIYSLDCSESFEFGEAGSLTEYTLESGAKVSDHYVSENIDLSLNGIITDLKTKSSFNQRSTDDFIHGLMTLKHKSETFKLYYRGESEKLDRFFDNVMFVNLRFSQDANMGYSGGLYAYRVSMSLKQIRFANKASVGIAQVPAIKGASDKKKTTSATTDNKPVDPSKVSTDEAEKMKKDPKWKYTYEQIVNTKKGGTQ